MKRFRFSFLLLLGLVLLAAGLLGLSRGPALTQYAFLPPSDPAELLNSFSQLQKNLAESWPVMTIHGQKSGVTLTAEKPSAGSGGGVRAPGASQNDVTLYLTGPRWSEVYPRAFVTGRPLSALDSLEKNPVIVLDRETAFLFFGEADPLGRMVSLDGERLEVVGVAEHSRRVGETGGFAAWVPLGTLSDCDLMVLSAPASPDISLQTVFQTSAAEVFGSGTLINLPKEGQRATMVLRWTGLVLALWGLMACLRRYAAYIRTQWAGIREKAQEVYAGRLLPYAVLRLLPVALLGALLIAAGAGMAVLAVSPARVFPEWVPESLGDAASWVSRFRSLTGENAKPVLFRTPEAAEVRFWAGLIRWGTLLVLLSQWKAFFPGKKQQPVS